MGSNLASGINDIQTIHRQYHWSAEEKVQADQKASTPVHSTVLHPPVPLVTGAIGYRNIT
jgi:hypothetical protein